MLNPKLTLFLCVLIGGVACGDDDGATDDTQTETRVDEPTPTPATATTPTTPTTATPTTPRAPDSPALAAVRAAFAATFQDTPYRVRTDGIFTPTGREATHMDIVTEHVPPDRMHVRLSADGAPPTELVRIGGRGWMGVPGSNGRLVQVPDGAPPPPPSAHELMLAALDAGDLTVEPRQTVAREGTTYDAYHVTGDIQVPTGSMTGSGTILIDPATHRIGRIESDFTGAENRFQSQHTIEVDANIRIEPPAEPAEAPAE